MAHQRMKHAPYVLYFALVDEFMWIKGGARYNNPEDVCNVSFFHLSSHTYGRFIPFTLEVANKIKS